MRSPSVRRAFPPVGVHRTAEQLPQRQTVWLWLKTVVMLKHPWHLREEGSKFLSPHRKTPPL